MITVESQLERGVRSAADLRQRLGVSPATLMRMVHAAGPDVIRFGRARATRYGLRQAWQGLDSARFPVFRVTPSGTAVPGGDLITLPARQSVWMPDGSLSNGLPIELLDARPSGFLGRHFASVHADLRLPARLADWSDHHILLAISRRGEDLPGDLIIGEESFARWQSLGIDAVGPADYPALAEATIAGHPPGSSAGGEHPKFGVLAEGRHRLVKFAARGSSSDRVARRWSDLLVLEATALDVVATRGIAAARTRVIETATHWFLESERFDRAGERGRVPVLSLAAVHDDLADTWARAARALDEEGRISTEDARRLRWLDAFGAMIGNTDRHQYNVLFFVEGPALRLAPAFDQVSTLYAPTLDGQVPPREFAVPAITADTLDVWPDARDAAREFWARASADARVSADVRSYAEGNTRLLADQRP